MTLVHRGSATARAFRVALLQLAAMVAFGSSTCLAAETNKATVWDIEGKGMTVDNSGTLLPAYLASPIGATNRTTVVILHGAPGISKEVQEIARDIARTGYVALVIDCANRGGAAAAANRELLLGESFNQLVQSDVRAGITTINGNGPDANPVVLMGFGAGGYTALRMALSDPLRIVGVITMYTPIESAEKATLDPRPDLITLLARLNVPAQFHVGTTDPALSRENLNWLGRFVAVDPERRQLFLYGGAGHGFYEWSASGFDKGYQMLARRRWQEFLVSRFN